MSAKQDKKLRRIAKGLSVVLEQSGRQVQERGLFGSCTGSLMNRADSFRGIARTLKKGLRTGNPNAANFLPLPPVNPKSEK